MLITHAHGADPPPDNADGGHCPNLRSTGRKLTAATMDGTLGAAASDGAQLAGRQLAAVLRELADSAGDFRHDLSTAIYYYDDERRRAGQPGLTHDACVQIIRAVYAGLPGATSGNWRVDLQEVNNALDARREELGRDTAERAALPQMLRDAADQAEALQPESTREGGTDRV